MDIINTATDVQFIEGTHKVSFPKNEHDVALHIDRIKIVSTSGEPVRVKLTIKDVSEVASIVDGVPVAVPATISGLYDTIRPYFNA